MKENMVFIYSNEVGSDQSVSYLNFFSFLVNDKTPPKYKVIQTCSPQLTVIWNSFAEYILATIEEKSSSYEFLKSCSQF